MNWDLRNYHFYNGYALIYQRLNQDWRPAFLQSNMNPAIDWLLYHLVITFSPLGVGMALTSIQVLNLLGIFILSKQFISSSKIRFQKLFIFLSTVVGFFCAGNLGQIGGTMGDNFVSIFFLFALIFFFHQSRKSTLFQLMIQSLLVGTAVGLKLPVAIFGIVFYLLVLVRAMRNKDLRVLFITCISGAFGFLLSAGLWMWNNFRMFGSPVFPFFNGIFHSKFAAGNNFFDSRFLPNDIYEFILFPFQIAADPLQTAEVTFRDYRVLAAFISIILSGILLLSYFLMRKAKLKGYIYAITSDDRWLLLLFWMGSYLLWLKIFGIYRYIVLLEFLSPLIIILVFSQVIEQLLTPKDRAAGYLTLMLTLLFLLLTTKPVAWERVNWFKGRVFSLTYDNREFELSNSTLLMYGGNPYGFVVPLLPKSMNAVRIDQIETEEQRKLIHSRIREKKFVLKEKNTKPQTLEAILNRSSLTLNNESCISVHSNLIDYKLIPPFEFCEVKEITAL
jgi:hypothetical protein